jgi:putative transposase
MAKPKGYSAEQIIMKLREAEVLLSQGQTVKQICRVLEESEQTYYRWRREYGGLNTTQANKLKELEKENTRLKKLVADVSLDKMIETLCPVQTGGPILIVDDDPQARASHRAIVEEGFPGCRIDLRKTARRHWRPWTNRCLPWSSWTWSCPA